MPLYGNTRTYDLTSVLQFLSENNYSGSLFFYPEKRKEVFYLVEGNIKVPFNGDGIPNFEAEAVFIPPEMTEQTPEERQKFIGKARVEAEAEAFLRFFYEAHYRFERDLVPEEILSGEYPSVTLPTGSVLMEGNRLKDDVHRATTKIPERGAVFEVTGEPHEKDIAEIHALLDGSRDATQVVDASPMIIYKVWAELERLFDSGRLRQLETSEYVPRLQQLISEGKLNSALNLYRHIWELNELESKEQASIHLFSNVELWQNSANLKSFRGNMPGDAFTYILQETVKSGLSVVYEVSYDEFKYGIVLLPESISIYQEGIDHGMTTLTSLCNKAQVPENISDYLRQSAPFTVPNMQMVFANAGVELSVKWDTFLVNRVVDLMSPLYNQTLKISAHIPSEYSAPSGNPFTCTYGENSRDMLEMLLGQWVSVRQEAPPDNSIFTCSRKSRQAIEQGSNDVTMDTEFLKLFYRNRVSLAEVFGSARDKLGSSEFFFKTVAHIAAANLRPLTSEELQKLIQTSMMEEDYDRALSIIRSAEAMKYEDKYFSTTREEIRLLTSSREEGDRLVGDLRSFSLAEVLQNLVTNQYTGTMQITSSAASQEIYFFRGEVSILKKDEKADEETLATFVSDSALSGLDFLSNQGEEVDEFAINDELALHVQDQIYEIFLWDDAQFTFILDALPPEFFSEDDDITKLELNTMSFLMGAVSRLEEWSEISTVISSEQAIFKFISPEYKQMALASGGDVQLLYLIDGNHNIQDLIRITNRGKFEVCSILYDLSLAGYTMSLDVNELIQRGKEAYERKDYPASRKFYSFASMLNPRDARILKIVEGLTNRIAAQKNV